MAPPPALPTEIEILGPPAIDSPLTSRIQGGYTQKFVSDDTRVVYTTDPLEIQETLAATGTIPSFEKAGPREKIYFDPAKLKCAIVTCGGLCPGLNDIIRSVTLELYHCYGVHHIFGIQYGLQGFIPAYGHDTVPLTPDYVSQIMDMGGTILGSSRGTQDIGNDRGLPGTDEHWNSFHGGRRRHPQGGPVHYRRNHPAQIENKCHRHPQNH